MGRELKSVAMFVALFFVIMLIVDSVPFTNEELFQNAVAPIRENSENITIPANDVASLNLAFNSGDELELIFTLTVKQDLPIDVWFVNYANYIRLVDGNEFLYFLDGSDKEVKTASKVVTVSQHGSYVLVLANYNNESVDVFLTYDVNRYPLDEDTTPSGSDKGEEIPVWQEYYVMLPLGLIVGLIVGILVASLINKRKTPSKTVNRSLKKKRKAKKAAPIATATAPKKKVKALKLKQKEPQETKKVEEKEIDEPNEEVSKTSEEKPETIEKAPSAKFCGNCGSAVSSKFCQSCGTEVGNA